MLETQYRTKKIFPCSHNKVLTYSVSTRAALCSPEHFSEFSTTENLCIQEPYFYWQLCICYQIFFSWKYLACCLWTSRQVLLACFNEGFFTDGWYLQALLNQPKIIKPLTKGNHKALEELSIMACLVELDYRKSSFSDCFGQQLFRVMMLIKK